MSIEPERLIAIQDACEIVLFENQTLEKGEIIYLAEEYIKAPSFLVAYSKETIEIQVQLKHDDQYYDLDEPTGNRAFMFVRDELKVRPLPCGNLRFLVKAYKNCTSFVGIYQPLECLLKDVGANRRADAIAP